jgi:hypothetical protein
LIGKSFALRFVDKARIMNTITRGDAAFPKEDY